MSRITRCFFHHRKTHRPEGESSERRAESSFVSALARLHLILQGTHSRALNPSLPGLTFRSPAVTQPWLPVMQHSST